MWVSFPVIRIPIHQADHLVLTGRLVRAARDGRGSGREKAVGDDYCSLEGSNRELIAPDESGRKGEGVSCV